MTVAFAIFEAKPCFATAKNPITATEMTCRETSTAFSDLRALLQLVHCTTCDQYLKKRMMQTACHVVEHIIQTY
jgi:hypothetical protein